MKLLIVDDSMMIRNVIEALLKSRNFEVVGKAANGVEAIAMFKEHNPDLVTLDITMPEMDGLAAMEIMLAHKPDAKIVIVSALNSKAIGLQAMSKGAKAIVEKPVNEAKLEAALNIALK